MKTSCKGKSEMLECNERHLAKVSRNDRKNENIY